MVEKPALQVIVLGSGGGPKEDNTTAFLVRSTTAQWKRGSVLAVDAGTHLAAIARILERSVTEFHGNNQSSPLTLTSGPFQGLQLPFASVNANAAHITRYLVDTYLITHPHLDHISGFVVNTAGFLGPRPKRLAALPSTIAAFKAHIFNNVIWPNLSDENNGVGLVTYMRLVDGGSPALGDGDGRGYIEICEGLSVKAMSISHGHFTEKHGHRGSVTGISPHEYSPDYDTPQRSATNSGSNGRFGMSPEHYDRRESNARVCVYDSSAYFVRDIATGAEVLMLGDVEPDSLSLIPRNQDVWTAAAPKIVAGLLRAIFIECSYSDSQADGQLFGHLAPRFLFKEMKMLASRVESARQQDLDGKRRKRKHAGSPSTTEYGSGPRRSPRVSALNLPTYEQRRHGRSGLGSISMSPPPETSGAFEMDVHVSDTPGSPTTSHAAWSGTAGYSFLGADDQKLGDIGQSKSIPKAQMPLKGLKVVIIHVKDKLDDAELVEDIILRQMKSYEEDEKLGCEFIIAKVGMSVFV